MTNLILIIGALLFLLILWTLTYRGILKHHFVETKKNSNAMDAKFLQLHDKLPYLLEVLKEHGKFKECKGKEIVELRVHFTEKISPDKKNDNYAEIKDLLDKILDAPSAEFKKDTGFLESRTELHDLDDELRLIKKQYNEHVREYNSRLIKFPGNLVGSLFKMSSIREL
jgi:LemA protein